MDEIVMQSLENLQQFASRQIGGGRIDIHYREGYGALATPEGVPLVPTSVIMAIPDEMLKAGVRWV